MLPAMARRAARRPPKAAHPDSTITPDVSEARAVAADPPPGLSRAGLDSAILRYLRRWPNQTVELGPLAEELGIAPDEMQLAARRLHTRGMIVAPFVLPERAGAGTLTQVGLRWLIDREGGRPADIPVAYQKAGDHIRAADEAARLPRAQVYGIARGRQAAS